MLRCAMQFVVTVFLVAIIVAGCQQQQELEAIPTTTVKPTPSAEPGSANPEVVVVSSSSENKTPPQVQPDVSRFVPDWVAEAVFYQIFPDRFRNGDPDNDPTRESLEDVASIPEAGRYRHGPEIGMPAPNGRQELSGSFFRERRL